MKRAFIKLPNHGSGFFSNYFSVLSMIIEANNKNLKPYVDLSNTAWVEEYNPYIDNSPRQNSENPWDWWFDQEDLNPNDDFIEINYTRSNFDQNTKVWKRKDLPNAKNIAKKYIKIKKEILEQVEYIYREYFDNKNVLGIMARGTEMNNIHPEFGNQNIDSWIKKTNRIINKHPNIDLLFIVSEDSEYIKIFLDNFKNVFYLKDIFRRTDESLEYTVKYPLWPCLDINRKNHCKKLGEEMLIQALLLSKCKYLIAKQCGTSSAAIFYSDIIQEVYYVETFPFFNPNLPYRTRIRLVLKMLLNKLFNY